MTPTQAKDHLIPEFKKQMALIGLNDPKHYKLSDDGKTWAFMYLRGWTDSQYEQAHELLASILNS